ncbi:MAG: glutathione ABC transporter substrate-binding protein [Turicibacter sp.]|nr:glutathione ABC transporter substrate-binding protein [Turicibacter sp.]
MKKLFALLFGSLFLAACGAATSVADNHLIITQNGDPVTLDPHGTNDLVSAVVQNIIFERLVYLNPAGELEPSLATGWTRIDDRTYEFTIRQDVYFHNGLPMTVEDVAFSLKRAATATVIAPILGEIDPESIEIMDEETIRVGTFEPFVPLLAHLSHTGGNIVSQAAVEYYGERFGQHPVGTGAFKFVEWLAGDFIMLSRFEDYYGDAPHMDFVEFRNVPEAANRLIELETGEAHIALNIAPNDIPRLESDPNLELYRGTNLRTHYMGMNTTSGPLQDVRVRQAINYAINAEDIIAGILEGVGTLSTGPISQDVWGANPDLVPYAHNPERGRELLAEAGYADGFTTTLWVDVDVTRQAIATVIRNQLLEIGITAELQVVEWATLLEATSAGNHDLFILGWTSVTLDADYGIFPLFHSSHTGAGGNRAFYNNPEVDRLLELARAESDEARRLAYYHEIQEIIVHDAPWAFLYVGEAVIGMNANLRGFQPNPNGHHRVTDVWFEQ